MRYVVGFGDRSTRRGTFRGEFEARCCNNQWGLYGVRVRQCRDAAPFPNYFGQTCYYYAASLSLEAQRPIVIKLSRGRSVGLCVGLSSALWKNGGSDPDAIWRHRSDGSRGEASSWVWRLVLGKGYFWGRI